MPKISAATVAEHRARQRSALVAAARALLLSGGYEGLTFSALAQQAGLARPSVYSYFESKDDLVLAVCEMSLPGWLARIDEAMARARSPRSKLVAFVRAQLEAAAAGEHRLAAAVEHAPLSPQTWDRIAELHEKFAPKTSDVIAALGHQQPETTWCRGRLTQRSPGSTPASRRHGSSAPRPHWSCTASAGTPDRCGPGRDCRCSIPSP